MPNIENLKKYKKIHLVGIGGISMSGIAEILKNWGYTVTGSNNVETEITKKLKENGIRAEFFHGERLPKLIRNAEKQKIPLMAVVGPKEVETQSVTIRSRFSGELGTMTIDDFISGIKSATEKRTLL